MCTSVLSLMATILGAYMCHCPYVISTIIARTQPTPVTALKHKIESIFFLVINATGVSFWVIWGVKVEKY